VLAWHPVNCVIFVHSVALTSQQPLTKDAPVVCQLPLDSVSAQTPQPSTSAKPVGVAKFRSTKTKSSGHRLSGSAYLAQSVIAEPTGAAETI